MATDSPSLTLRPPAKGSTITVLGLIPQPGEWLAAYSTVRLGKATLADVCALSDLPGPQRRRADVWMGQFDRLIGAASSRAG